MAGKTAIMNRQEFLTITLRSFGKWLSHDATLRAGALTFFTIMPLPSFMLIGAAILAQIYGRQQAFQQLTHQIIALTGPTVADLFSKILLDARNPYTSLFGSIVGVAFAIGGVLGAFSVLQKSLNVTWEVKPTTSVRKEKIVPFILLITFGFIAVFWTAFSTVFFSVAVHIFNPLFGGLTPLLLRALQVVVSLGLGVVLFAVIFKEIPEVDVQWRDVWWAALITSIIFTFFNYLFGIYLSFAGTTTLAGTAGTLMFLLSWIYLTNLFVLFGGEFSAVYAETLGSHKGRVRLKQKPVKRIDVKTKLEWKVTSKT